MTNNCIVMGKSGIAIGLVMLFVLLGYNFSFAQKDVNMNNNPSFFDRVYTGGGFGFSSNSIATNLSVSPLAGYMITRKLSAGVGVTYQYYRNNIFDAEDHRYGGKVFAVQMLVYQFFLYGEYNFINLSPRPWDDTVPRETFSRMMLGGGFSQPLGRRGAFNFIVAYDITHDSSSPYASPWVIGGFISF